MVFHMWYGEAAPVSFLLSIVPGPLAEKTFFLVNYPDNLQH